jgi:hypothetical protein
LAEDCSDKREITRPTLNKMQAHSQHNSLIHPKTLKKTIFITSKNQSYVENIHNSDTALIKEIVSLRMALMNLNGTMIWIANIKLKCVEPSVIKLTAVSVTDATSSMKIKHIAK